MCLKIVGRTASQPLADWPAVASCGTPPLTADLCYTFDSRTVRQPNARTALGLAQRTPAANHKLSPSQQARERERSLGVFEQRERERKSFSMLHASGKFQFQFAFQSFVCAAVSSSCHLTCLPFPAIRRAPFQQPCRDTPRKCISRYSAQM